MITPPDFHAFDMAEQAALAMSAEKDGSARQGSARQFLDGCPDQAFHVLLRTQQRLLHLACSLGLADCVQAALARGSDAFARLPQAGDSTGFFAKPSGPTPLMLAAGAGSAACVELLGASFQGRALQKALGATDHEGSTAFHWAAVRAHDGALRALLELDRQAPPKRRHAWDADRLGNTPATLAARAGSRLCLEALRDEPGPWHLANRDGFNPLSMAIQHRNLECCEFFASLLNPLAFALEAPARAAASQVFDSVKPHPLIQAAKLGETAIFAALAPAALACCPPLGIFQKERERALRDQLLTSCQGAFLHFSRIVHLCCRAHQQWSIADDVPMSRQARQAQEALIHAAAADEAALFTAFERLRRDSPDAVRAALLGSGPDRTTILHVAAAHGRSRFIYTVGQWLGTSAREALDRVDHLGRSPLAHAAAAGSLEACKALLLHGAAPDAEDFAGRSPMMAAIQAGSASCAKALNFDLPEARGRSSRSADGLSPAMAAASMGRADLLTWILNGADPSQENLPDARGDTLLHHVCRHAGADESRLACLRLALDLPGANPNALNLQGLSPLNLAAARGWAQGVEALAPLHEPSLHLSSPSPLARAIDNAMADPHAGAMALLLARWIDPRAKEPYRLSAPMNACARANFLKQPQLAQALVGLAELWTLGEPPGRQDPALLLAPKNLAQAVAHFRSKIHQASHRLGADSSRSLPPRQTPP